MCANCSADASQPFEPVPPPTSTEPYDWPDLEWTGDGAKWADR